MTINEFLNNFYDWTKHADPELKDIVNLLSRRLSDEPAELIKDLMIIETWYYRCGYLLAEANSFLDKGAFFYKPEKEGHTEFDRKIMLDGHLVKFRETRNKIEALQEGIKTRITLGQSVLSYHKRTMDNSYLANPKPIF